MVNYTHGAQSAENRPRRRQINSVLVKSCNDNHTELSELRTKHTVGDELETATRHRLGELLRARATGIFARYLPGLVAYLGAINNG